MDVSLFFLPGNKCLQVSFHGWILTRMSSAASVWGSSPFLQLQRLWWWYEMHMKSPAWEYVLLLLHIWKRNSLRRDSWRKMPFSFFPPPLLLKAQRFVWVESAAGVWREGCRLPCLPTHRHEQGLCRGWQKLVLAGHRWNSSFTCC